MKGLLKLAMVSSAIAMTATPAFSQSADWTKKVFGIVAAKQTYPRVAQMRGDEGTAKVRVSVDAAGAIKNVEMVAPSGSSVLDKEALELPRRIATLPPPPGGATTVVLPLTWKLM